MTRKSSEKHKRRKSKRSVSGAAAQHDLLRYAAMGKAKKLHKLLKAEPQLDLDAADANGDTALHHACHGNHINIARLLLRRVPSSDINMSWVFELTTVHGGRQGVDRDAGAVPISTCKTRTVTLQRT